MQMKEVLVLNPQGGKPEYELVSSIQNLIQVVHQIKGSANYRIAISMILIWNRVGCLQDSQPGAHCLVSEGNQSGNECCFIPVWYFYNESGLLGRSRIEIKIQSRHSKYLFFSNLFWSQLFLVDSCFILFWLFLLHFDFHIFFVWSLWSFDAGIIAIVAASCIATGSCVPKDFSYLRRLL